MKRFLLLRESLQQIIRLLLLNAYVISKSELIRMIEKIYQICSTFFNFLLFKFEQQVIDDENYLTITQNSNYFNFAVLARFQFKYCREILRLSIRASSLSDDQIKIIQWIYKLDYMMFNVQHLKNNQIRWCKKFSFDDK